MSAPDTIVATLPRQPTAVHGFTVRPFVFSFIRRYRRLI